MGKPIRLGKAAGELNVGISTLVDFLGSKGVKIDINPNTKLEEEHYDLLRKEFAADQNMKEQSKFTTVKKEKRETISIRDKSQDDAPETTPEEEENEPISVEEIKRAVLETPEPEPEKEADDKQDIKVSVVGKIDLESINTKTRPDKKQEEVEEKQPEAKEEPKPEPVEEKKKEEAAPAKEEIETIRVERKTLSGPTVLGRIELPVDKPKTPSQKANDDSNEARRKRKRIKKIDVNKAADTNQNTANKGNFKKGGPRVDKPEISEQDIQKEIKETLARLSNQGGKSKASKNRRAKRDVVAQRRQEEMLQAELEEKVLKLTEFVTVSELASMMNVSPTQVISACMSLGIFASINQRLDAETIQIVADEFGYETQFVSADIQEAIPVQEDKEEELISRPPIITVMGHVDHGKTSLLDKIRNANVTEGEAGGITQHIGAYSVTLKDGRKMTFLDTPGHEAFTAMRARGAQVTDVAIIIVAADDDVMPQTKEAISHAQAAGVPMVFAINKIDKPGANPDKIREQLSQMNILVEDWGGKYQVQEISAKQNLNIDELLDKVLLEAELLNLKANPNKNALGTVIESSLDKGKGYVTNMLVEAGTMKIGDVILVGRHFGRVRAMQDEHGKNLKEAGPSQPVAVLGINGAPSAGDKFHVMDDEREAKAIATKREQLYREQGLRTTKHITLDEIGRRLAIGDFKELNIIVKGDVDGSIEALSDSLLNLSTEEIQVNIVHKGVGAISEADVNLASASDAIIIGFQVRPTLGARKLAETEQIDIRLYSIIYKAIEEIKSAMEGMLSPDIEEKIIGSAEVRETFNITKVGTIAGCYVLDGLIKRTSKIRIIRDGIVIHTGLLGSLKRFKDDVKEVKNNYECGLNIDKFNDIQVGDIIEAFEEVEVARKL
ncbi:MAG: translation initiation factor IF-2 [Bacteroidetes bacterium]|nr:MAG: translation initiation factor IF-2 [Bacteroidota bacterium]